MRRIVSCYRALRAIMAKTSMKDGVGENMNEANLYGVLTILATIFLLPVALVVEPPAKIMAAIAAAKATGLTAGMAHRLNCVPIPSRVNAPAILSPHSHLRRSFPPLPIRIATPTPSPHPHRTLPPSAALPVSLHPICPPRPPRPP